MAMTDEQRLIVELAFAIEDPTGLDEILLAKALIAFARKVPACNRRAMAELLESATLEEVCKLERIGEPCHVSN
jgi:hypothetical protein